MAMNIDQPVHEVDADKEDRYTGYRKSSLKERGETLTAIKRAESENGRIIEGDSKLYSRTNSKSVLSRQGETYMNQHNPFISRNMVTDGTYRS